MRVDLSISVILETLVSKQVDEKVSTPVAVQPALLKIDAACEYLAIGKSTLYRMQREGKIPAPTSFPHGPRYSRDMLDKLIRKWERE